MPPEVRSLFPPAEVGSETLEVLSEGRGFRLEHIVSRGEASPEGFWYDQPEDEWVALVRGEARLAFEDGDLLLHAGDALVIPAGCRHRVAEVSSDAVWVALHFDDARSSD